MATLEIKVKDNIFVSHNDVKVENFTPYYIEGNGWKCKIYRDGNISCSATNTYYGVEHELFFNIKAGWVKLKLRIGDRQEEILKCYKVEKWPVDGVIRLSDGFISRRKAVFRDSEFQGFLEKYGITALRYEHPDAVYKIVQEVCEGVTTYQEFVDSDGVKELIYDDVKYSEDSNEKSFIVTRLIEVTNATWALKTYKKSGVFIGRVLYTKEKLQEIMGLPKLE